MPRTDLGKAMRIYRATHDLTQWELGKKIDAEPTIVSRIERGDRQPTPKQAAKLRKLGILEGVA